MQSVRPRRQRFPLDGNIIGESNRRILIRARAPHFSVGHRLAPDLPPADRGTVISNGDVRQPNSLRYRSALARTRNIQLRRLTPVLELRAGVHRQCSASHENAKSILPHVAHDRISPLEMNLTESRRPYIPRSMDAFGGEE